MLQFKMIDHVGVYLQTPYCYDTIHLGTKRYIPQTVHVSLLSALNANANCTLSK